MDNNPFATPSTGPNEHVQSGVQAVLFDPYGAYCFGVVRAPRPALLRAVEITVARSGEPEHVWGRPEEAIRAASGADALDQPPGAGGRVGVEPL